MDEDLEEFEIVTGDETIVPDARYEGSNASRLALVATLGGNQENEDDLRSSLETPFARFGLNPSLLDRAEWESPAEYERVEAERLIAQYRSGWTPEDVRVGAWLQLDDGDVLARLPFLVAGLCSPLERESVTAGVAIVNSVASAAGGSTGDIWYRWPPVLDELGLDRSLLGAWLPLTPLPLEEGESPDPVVWVGEAWRDVSARLVDDAVALGDVTALLGSVRSLARLRVGFGHRSSDAIVRQLAAASFLAQPASPAHSNAEPTFTERSGELTSTIVHGTWGWKGDWWYPGGDFHQFVLDPHRPRLYAGGQEFSWSGAYSEQQRATGGDRFKRWASSVGGADGLGSVFGHSYGGEIIARAVNQGALIDEVVLLSAPIHDHHELMLGRVRRVVDVRLENDIVLVLARARQRLPDHADVVRYIIDRPYWSHGASHHPEVWRSESIAAQVDL